MYTTPDWQMRQLRRCVRRAVLLLCASCATYLVAAAALSFSSAVQERRGMAELGEPAWGVHGKKSSKISAEENLRELAERYFGDETPSRGKDGLAANPLAAQKLNYKPLKFSEETGAIDLLQQLNTGQKTVYMHGPIDSKSNYTVTAAKNTVNKSNTNENIASEPAEKLKGKIKLGGQSRDGTFETAKTNYLRTRGQLGKIKAKKIQSRLRESRTSPSSAVVALALLKAMKTSPLARLNFRRRAQPATSPPSSADLLHNRSNNVASGIDTIFVRAEEEISTKLPSGTDSAESAEAQEAYNHSLSDALPLDRSIPDTRPACCAEEHEYQIPAGVSVSVVVAHHNERTSTLMRTIASVVRNTPAHLLHQVVLVDDASDARFQVDLEGKIPRVVHLRNEGQLGVTASRARGAAACATSSHIAFLDSHCEVNRGWLLPLLAAALQTPSAVVSPVLDVIDARSLQYRPTPQLLRGGFGWGLRFRWLSPGHRANSSCEAYSTPVMGGGLFLVARARWQELGGYDPGFLERGGDSIEMSLKSWLCGGRVLVAPCSRVGHLFLKSSVKKAGSVLRNSRRIAEVWLDDFRQFFYDLRPQALYKLHGNISSQLELKKKLACRKFSWYLKNVYPELTPPRRVPEEQGKLRHEQRCLSLVTAAPEEPAKKVLAMEPCSSAKPVVLTTDGLLTVDEWCLASGPPADAGVFLKSCGVSTAERWDYDGATGQLVHVASSRCLAEAVGRRVSTQPCSRDSRVNAWTFE